MQYYIKIKLDTYREYTQVAKKKTNIILIGEGMDTTIIAGVRGDDCTGQDITFRNDDGPIKHQTVALRVEADFASFYRCRLDGYLPYIQKKMIINFNEIAKSMRGSSSSFKLKIELENSTTGIVLQNCTIKAAKDLNNVNTYFGRPWGKFSRTVIESTNKFVFQLQLYYLEYKNRGPGAITKGRVTWTFITTDQNIASNITVRHFINGDKWIPANVPNYLNFS
ncbi:hypothetical protein H5410_052891 [Solanum commersonii]|uniref:Pectinesterase catalytic domain-containing protein n=1 Tax=Solanum commersonii TaxID=4109 RepID=A0A9J5X5H4_SOLCO|nr:hypothetical protein H5410_052891 [Solanum commersonii]